MENGLQSINLHDDTILLLRPESYRVAFLYKIGLLLFKPRWDYQI